MRYLLQLVFGPLLDLCLRLVQAFGRTISGREKSREIFEKPNPEPTSKTLRTAEIDPQKITRPFESRINQEGSGMAFLSELPTVPFDAVLDVSEEFELDPFVVAAIIATESAGNRFAMRYEPHYTYLFKVDEIAKNLLCTSKTEEVAQKTSWGLMQIMGAVARERGYRGWLSELTDMVVNLRYGCAHLKGYFEKYGNLEEAVASYNAGSPRLSGDSFVNQDYVDKVISMRNKMERSNS